MKTIPSGLGTHEALGTTTLAFIVRIVRPDATVYAFTSSQDSLTISGTTYLPDPGVDVSNLVTSSGLNVDNLEMTVVDDGYLFVRGDVLDGKWRNATFVISRVNYANPSAGTETLLSGTFGEIGLHNGHVVVELRGLQQYLQQQVGIVTSKTCRARLGDTACTKDLTSFTYTGTLTSVASSRVFTDSGRAEATGWFDDGLITFTSGPLVNTSWKIKTFAAGVFTLSVAPFQSVTASTTYTAIAGCRKRMAEDCATKFSNVLNFQAEPHLPGMDALTKPVG